MRPLEQWRGTLGDTYTERNDPDWHSRERAWRAMTHNLCLRSILEVGCNRGVNLVVLRHINPNWKLVGIEPNSGARDLALASGVLAVNGSAETIPFTDGNFDLVFTAGVLIHVPPAELDAALAELYRVTARYLVAIEYHADVETEIPYRNQTGLLWKRNYTQEYLRRFPDLHLEHSGYWSQRDGFDRCHWALMEKR